MTNEFNPDWDTQAVLVEEIQRMAKRIEELEAQTRSVDKDEPVAWSAGLIERIKAAEQRIQDGHAPRRIPADPSDVDLVLAEVRYLLEGKQSPFWVNTTPPPVAEPHKRPSRSDITWVGLTDDEIQEIVSDASRAGTLSWTGYKEDDEGKYTIPVLSLSDYQFARAIEAKLKEKNT